MSDLKLSSIPSANRSDCDFPLNNLPYGVFSTGGSERLCGIAIGDFILDATRLEADGILRASDTREVMTEGVWNSFMTLGKATWASYRDGLTKLLSSDADPERLQPYLMPLSEAILYMPLRVSEFTDFYASHHHATNVGTMFRGTENALPPNWLHMPIGYNGRASSVVVSETPVIRPRGQVKELQEATPRVAASGRFDFELELGAIVGQPSDGPIGVAEAFENIFGYVLLNDWSARDIQAWEYQPLGPFQSKATATTISPWIVTAEALEPFRTATPNREVPLLPYLQDPDPMLYDVSLEVGLAPEGYKETTLTRTNARELYYSAAQQLAHHASSGCPMRVGDLLGSGTISGPKQGSQGSLLELSWGGEQPVSLATGETRAFLMDGDTVTFRGHASGNGYRIGFGTCRGKILAAGH